MILGTKEKKKEKKRKEKEEKGYEKGKGKSGDGKNEVEIKPIQRRKCLWTVYICVCMCALKACGMHRRNSDFSPRFVSNPGPQFMMTIWETEKKGPDYVYI